MTPGMLLISTSEPTIWFLLANRKVDNDSDHYFIYFESSYYNDWDTWISHLGYFGNMGITRYA